MRPVPGIGLRDPCLSPTPHEQVHGRVPGIGYVAYTESEKFEKF